MRFALLCFLQSEFPARVHKTLWRLLLLALFVCPSAVRAADEFEARTWTDRKGNQMVSTFVDAKNGEAQFKDDEGKITKFKLADFSEPDQKYLRDLANYRRKQAAGEKADLPVDPAKASVEIQPLQTITEPVADMLPYRKPLLDFPIRVWTDSTGKKVQAKLVTAYNDKVVLDVKGSPFDLPITKFSLEDQQYITTQLKGLQRDDLVNILAKVVAAKQQQQSGAAPPPATTVASNTPPVELGNDDIKARLAQLEAQRQGNDPNAGTQAAANMPPAQPLPNDDIKARLAQIRQQKGEPEPEVVPSTVIPAAPRVPQNPAFAHTQQVLQEQRERMERQRQEADARMNQMAADARARQEELNRQMRSKHSPSSISNSPFQTKVCGNCGRNLPDHITAGDRCPGCGVTFDYDETNLAGSIGYRVGQGIGVLLILGLVGAGIKKLAG